MGIYICIYMVVYVDIFIKSHITLTYVNVCFMYTEMYRNMCSVVLALTVPLLDKIRIGYSSTSGNNKLEPQNLGGIIKIYL